MASLGDDRDPTDAAIARYLAGEADARERAVVEAWAGAAEANRAELVRLSASWQTRPPGEPWNVDAAWRRVSPSLSAAEVRPLPAQATRPRMRNPVLALAAALVLAVGGVFAWRTYIVLPSGAEIVVATAVGEQRRVDLGDGTAVTLSPASELRVDAGFGVRNRRVDLTGEAWFEVAHNERRAFEVHAGGTITRDIGTAFSVRALPGDSSVRVVVVEGIASLRRDGTPPSDGVTLNARDVGVLGASGGVRVAHGMDVGALTAWRTGYLEFSDVALGEVAAELERWHAVTIQFADAALRSRNVTAPLPVADLRESLEILARALGVRIEMSGDTVVVR